MSLARVPALLLVRSRQAWGPVAGWGALVLGSAWMQRRHGAPHGADHALDLYAAVAVPLLVYGLVAVTAGQGLARAGRPLVRLGAPPSRVALATVLVTMAASAIACAVLGALAVALAHGPADPPLAHDALQTAGMGALAGAAYAAFFMVGAAALPGLWGRTALLVLDWVLGATDGMGALVTPRAHLRNLLGGEGPFETMPWESLAMLVGIAVGCVVLAVKRAARARV